MLKKRNRNQICPRCKSKDISPDLSASAITLLNNNFTNYKCNKCGYKGTFFPIIEKVGKSKIKMKQIKIKNIKSLKKEKKAQIMGMSFEMIFAILLTAIFLFAAIFAIKHFIDLKNCSDTVSYFSNLQSKIDEVWSSEYTKNTYFSGPTALTAICFVNVSLGKNIGTQQNKELIEQIWAKAKDYESSSFNVFLWPTAKAKACGVPVYKTIQHISLPTQNPLCFFNSQGMIKINLEKGYDDSLVRIVK